jgi:hypothetical protein
MWPIGCDPTSRDFGRLSPALSSKTVSMIGAVGRELAALIVAGCAATTGSSSATPSVAITRRRPCLAVAVAACARRAACSRVTTMTRLRGCGTARWIRRFARHLELRQCVSGSDVIARAAVPGQRRGTRCAEAAGWSELVKQPSCCRTGHSFGIVWLPGGTPVTARGGRPAG